MNRQLNELLQKKETSFYLFDFAILKKRIQSLREMLPPRVKLCYAVKANPFLISGIKDQVERLEICSPGEQRICDRLLVKKEKQVISGVYKTPSVMEALLADPTFHGIFTIESEKQFHLICSLAMKFNRVVPVLLRITNDSQFGLEEEIITHLIENRNEFPSIHICGLQFFSGTQKTSSKKLKRELSALDELLSSLKEKYDFEAKELEYGPGFPVSYFQKEELSEEDLLHEFSQTIEEMKYQGDIILELGRSIAASCGEFFTHVVDMKKNKGTDYLLVDSGMHQLVYYGQYMAMKQPYFYVYGKEMKPPVKTYTICGSLCSMNDIIVKQALLPEIEISDILVFQNTGAYSVTEGISLFLSRDLPAVYLKKEDGQLVLARNGMETDQWNTPKEERV